MIISRSNLILTIFLLFYFFSPRSFLLDDVIPNQEHQFDTYFPVVHLDKKGDVYYVSPQGNDANPGSFVHPWKTITKAAQEVSPGDTVYIREGTYFEAPRFTSSGTETNQIRILAYPGERPIVDGLNQIPQSWMGLIHVSGDWVRISGFEVRNSRYVGIQLTGQHDTLEFIYSHHNQRYGIHIQGDYGTVEDSRLSKNAMVNENNQTGIRSPALYAGRDANNGITDYAILRNNTIWENWGTGITSGQSNGTLIEGNIVHNNSGNIKILDSTNIVCTRNFYYMTPGSITYGLGSNYGILLGDEKYTPPSANITIINNIAYGNLKNLSWYLGVQGGGMNNVLIANNTFMNNMPNDTNARNVDIASGSHWNVRILNNIIVQDDSQHIEDIPIDPQVILSHNLWSKPPREEILGTDDIIADPQLAQTGDPFSPEWFRLTASSPAINHAMSVPEVLDDYFGVMRDSLPDMGAIEYFP